MRIIGGLDVISSGGSFRGPRVLHRTENCEENAGLATVHCSRTIVVRKATEIRENRHMGSRQTYRVSAYNTSKQSENKIHDDTVARRFGFSGGVVPRVGGMGYLMDLPGAKWGRGFLAHRPISCRVVQPGYEGRIAG